jgi:hypothetical protein
LVGALIGNLVLLVTVLLYFILPPSRVGALRAILIMIGVIASWLGVGLGFLASRHWYRDAVPVGAYLKKQLENQWKRNLLYFIFGALLIVVSQRVPPSFSTLVFIVGNLLSAVGIARFVVPDSPEDELIDALIGYFSFLILLMIYLKVLMSVVEAEPPTLLFGGGFLVMFMALVIGLKRRLFDW